MNRALTCLVILVLSTIVVASNPLEVVAQTDGTELCRASCTTSYMSCVGAAGTDNLRRQQCQQILNMCQAACGGQ